MGGGELFGGGAGGAGARKGVLKVDLLQEKRGDVAGAEESYLAVVRAEPRDASALLNLGLLQEQRRAVAGAGGPRPMAFSERFIN